MDPALMGIVIIACCFAAGTFSSSTKRRTGDNSTARSNPLVRIFCSNRKEDKK